MWLRVGGEQYELSIGGWSSPDVSSSLETLQRFGTDPSDLVQALLEQQWLDPDLAFNLRDLLAQLEPEPVHRLSSAQLATAVVDLLTSGRLQVRHLPEPTLALDVQAPEEQPEEPPLVPEVTEDHWVSFQVVDNFTGEPYADVPLTITLPDGKTSTHNTDAQGLVEFDSVQKSGHCVVQSERQSRDLLKTLAFESNGASSTDRAIVARFPWWPRTRIRQLVPRGKRYPAKDDLRVVDVTHHRVKNGETIASVAAKYGLSSEELLRYNFGTIDSRQVQRLLRLEVGCRKQDPASGEFIFTISDDPGIIYIPKEFELSTLATNVAHIIRVCRIDPDPPPFIFSY